MFNTNLVVNCQDGEALPLSTHLKTPRGWKRLKDVKEQDTVVTPAGKISTVVGLYPQGITDIYRFHFEDGRFTDSHPKHIWLVDEFTYIDSEQSISKDNLTTTQDIVDHFNEYQYQIQLVARISGGNQASISGMECLVESLLRSSIPIGASVLELPYRDRFFMAKNLLLQSGYQITRGEIGFVSNNEAVCNSIQALVWSLGGVATKTNSHGPGFRVDIRHPEIGVLLPTEVYRINMERHQNLRLAIVGVEKRPPVETACIKIDDPDSLFVTDQYIVTHS